MVCSLRRSSRRNKRAKTKLLLTYLLLGFTFVLLLLLYCFHPTHKVSNGLLFLPQQECLQSAAAVSSVRGRTSHYMVNTYAAAFPKPMVAFIFWLIIFQHNDLLGRDISNSGGIGPKTAFYSNTSRFEGLQSFLVSEEGPEVSRIGSGNRG